MSALQIEAAGNSRGANPQGGTASFGVNLRQTHRLATLARVPSTADASASVAARGTAQVMSSRSAPLGAAGSGSEGPLLERMHNASRSSAPVRGPAPAAARRRTHKPQRRLRRPRRIARSHTLRQTVGLSVLGRCERQPGPHIGHSRAGTGLLTSAPPRHSTDNVRSFSRRVAWHLSGRMGNIRAAEPRWA